jgi:glucosamine--fructose-6-phosphate aminotransferase (isomerizing)
MAAPTTDSLMYQTMHRQPADLARLLDGGFTAARQAADRLAAAERVLLIGIGTSYHAALVGEWLLRAAGSDARAVMSVDAALYPDVMGPRPGDAVIVMAHTGVKRFSGEAMAQAAAAGVPVISVGSLTAEHPGSQLVLRTVEREKSAAFTASHLAAMTVLAQVAVELGERRQAPGVRGLRDALGRLPAEVAGVLAREAELVPLAREAVGRRIYAAGAGPNAATALEAVIKVREAAREWIDALPLEQFLHGPIVVVNAGDVALLVNVPGPGSARTAEIAAVLAAIGARLWLIGQPAASAPGAGLFPLPDLPELLSPLLAVVPMQIFAYHLAALKGVNPDRFRRDDPTYAAAFGLLRI